MDSYFFHGPFMKFSGDIRSFSGGNKDQAFMDW